MRTAGWIGLLLAMAAASACGREEAPARKGAPAEPAPRSVSTVAAAAGLRPRDWMVPGTLAARQRATLSSRMLGAVTALPLREGERFAQGDVLVRMDESAARADVQAAQAALDAARSDAARFRALRDKDAATPRELEIALSQADGARARLAAAQEQLRHVVLRAPFAGVVTARPVNVGDVVPPGSSLLQIEGDGGLEVVATLEARLAARIAVGDRVRVVVDGAGAASEAVVRSVSPAGDPTTHRLEMRADLAVVPGMRSGLFARVAITGDAGQPRVSVPAPAIVTRGGLTGVYVVAEGRAHLRWIEAGETEDGLTEVRAGIEAGERVILQPSGLADGVRVQEVAS